MKNPTSLPTCSAVTLINCRVPMRDGISLAADVYLNPDDPFDPRPVMLSFSPYGATATRKSYNIDLIRKRGYHCVEADCRGRFNSDGVMVPWTPLLAQDAYDLLEWISSQPWCNGNVVTVGGSYPGNTQLACLRSGHPALKACAPSAVTLNPYPIYYANGAIVLKFVSSWHIGVANRTAAPKGSPSFEEAIQTFPLSTVPERMHLNGDSWLEVLRNPGLTRFWKDRIDLQNLAKSQAGVFYQGSWYDMLGCDVFETFKALCEEVAPENAASGRQYSVLRVGPWGHGVNTPEGEIDFGKVAMVTEDPEIDFLDSLVAGRAPQSATAPTRMQIFTMGRNAWRYISDWPLPETKYTKFYLGDKAVTTEPPAAADASDTFDYDPLNPVPTCGGRIVGGGGQRDQTEIEKRDDVLVYTGDVLEKELEVTGRISAVLYIASSAPDTDFTVKLVDVYPDGRPFSVCDGIMRARFRDGLDKPERLMTPGEHVKLEFLVDITSYAFQPGHRIRFEISSSNFPHFSRNTNTGHDIADDTETVTAHQTVFRSAAEPSHIILPVI